MSLSKFYHFFISLEKLVKKEVKPSRKWRTESVNNFMVVRFGVKKINFT
jgi:hypothetical protein